MEGFVLEKAEALLRTGTPLSEFKPLFPDWESVLKFHSNRMIELHPGQKQEPATVCAGCGKAVPLEVVEFKWSAIYHTGWTVIGTVIGSLMALGIAGVMPYKFMRFATRHSLCIECYRRAEKGGNTDVFLRHLFFALILIGLLAGSMGLLFGTLLLFNNPTFKEVLGCLAAILVGTSCIALVFYLLKASQTLHLRRVPPSLRYIGKAPFVLDSACPVRLMNLNP
jgi:hypothetical protein